MDREEIVQWLTVESDPAIRWQVTSDLVPGRLADAERERSNIAHRGWGRQLLAAQDESGLWAGALYSPKWTSTTYTLLLLQRLGLPAGNSQALLGCRQLWTGARFVGGGLTFSKTVPTAEICMTGMLVSLTSYFGYGDDRLDATVQWLLDNQFDDGGWNCESLRTGSRHGSFNTSIVVLESLLTYRSTTGQVPVDDALHRGREFFLSHRLFKSHRTGAIIDPAFTRFPFPPQWHFDVVRGLEFFRLSGAEPDERLSDAVAVVSAARSMDGTWRHYRPYPGRYWMTMEMAGPSKWNTLRCLRVLEWWQ
ncbi:hypothetical protein BH683_008885 [Williamsia sp. 1138]|uniref:hypothetical protein n=1 Tax=Williamsia sp. 1138 TaxID=1903117 RepID=UPI000A0FC04F|nr:hypothetical protein [Williamsia sp. 1138]OZG29545.1 hypothetical protein BH683_008885 [Williamsia sp. 1138]